MPKIPVLILFLISVSLCSAELSEPLSVERLLAITEKELETELPKFDIAYINMVCAQGLPGAEAFDVPKALAKLDEWAKHIQHETQRHEYLFHRDKDYYNGSLAYYQIEMMVSVLSQDMGVRYNPELIESGALYDLESTRFYADSRDVFLHGLLSPRPWGTCASMPVLVVAIGRRLGYPLKLVRAKAHLFVRWESETERFNIEATGRGWNPYPDSHYRRWPHPFTKAEEYANRFLKSLSPAEALADFLGQRAYCLKEHKRDAEAKKAHVKTIWIYQLFNERSGRIKRPNML